MCISYICLLLSDRRPRDVGGSGRNQEPRSVLHCCLVWEGQADGQHGNKYLKAVCSVTQHRAKLRSLSNW